MRPGPSGNTMKRRTFTAHRRLLAAPAAMLALAGCAIGVDSAAQPVANVPTDLFSTTTASTVPDDAATYLSLYFVNASNNLVRVPVPREIQATPQEAIDALVTPSQEVLAAGLNTRLLSVEYTAEPVLADGGVLTVTVAGPELAALTDTGPDKVAKIYAQILCTVTHLGLGISQLVIADQDGPIAVLVSDAATPTPPPVTPANFNNCATDDTPLALLPTTTTSTTTPTTRRLTQPTVTETTAPGGPETPSTTPAAP